MSVAALPTGSELTAAEQLHAWHAALVAAGFSRDEALQLLVALIVSE